MNSGGNWRDLSSYLLESIRVQADVRQELFGLLCKTIKSAADPSEARFIAVIYRPWH